jgi:hypothetical protein
MTHSSIFLKRMTVILDPETVVQRHRLKLAHPLINPVAGQAMPTSTWST